MFADGGINTDKMLKDLSERELDSYAGGFVAYFSGVFCGHSNSNTALFKKCLDEYGIDTALSHLATFQVPQSLQKEDIDFCKSSGIFLPTMEWYRKKIREEVL